MRKLLDPNSACGFCGGYDLGTRCESCGAGRNYDAQPGNIKVEFGEGVVEGLAKIGVDANKEVRRGIIKSRINELRLEAGISRLRDEPKFMVAVSKEGTVVEPLDGIEKFAKLIVRECIAITDDLVNRNADGTWASNELYTDYNGALFEVKRRIQETFGVE